MSSDPLYPRHAAAVVSIEAPLFAKGKCPACGGNGRLGDDYCRRCGGTGGLAGDVTVLADAISAAADEVSQLREACKDGLAALQALLPYMHRMPVETEGYVRNAIKNLKELCRA